MENSYEEIIERIENYPTEYGGDKISIGNK